MYCPAETIGSKRAPFVTAFYTGPNMPTKLLGAGDQSDVREMGRLGGSLVICVQMCL